jgi:hypothetical protein
MDLLSNWKIDKSQGLEGVIYRIQNVNGHNIVEINPTIGGSETREELANLIKAAPNMLATLEAMKMTLPFVHEAGQCDKIKTRLTSQIDEAKGIKPTSQLSTLNVLRHSLWQVTARHAELVQREMPNCAEQCAEIGILIEKEIKRLKGLQ